MRRHSFPVDLRSFETVAESPEDTDRLATVVASLCRPGDVIALIGKLGAGKTRFTQALFGALGAGSHVRSPSFTLVNEYDGSLSLAHMDLYRLNDPEDLLDLGYEEYFYGQGVVVIEWADKAMSFLPEGTLFIEMSHVPGKETTRTIRFTGASARAQAMIAGVQESWRS
jgi:tRNA threonylcarbamoyladenosine biosynthesis protein TsaE